MGDKALIRHILPYTWYAKLWGDRRRWGLEIDQTDSCWQEWQHMQDRAYSETQRDGVGAKVNDAGYRVMDSVDLAGKTVLEIGAGDLAHHVYWQQKPDNYVLSDVSDSMMERASQRLAALSVPARTLLLARHTPLPLPDSSVDIVVSFYSLEHLYPLAPYVIDIHRVLKPGGLLVGAIPAEGGLAWGLGRMLTTRRWFKANTRINPDKLICWEHPNFADDIVRVLDQHFNRQFVHYWPFAWLPLVDVNLVLPFMYRKAG